MRVPRRFRGAVPLVDFPGTDGPAVGRARRCTRLEGRHSAARHRRRNPRDPDADQSTETGQEIYDYFNAILDERQKHPRDDILSQFLRSEVDGDRLTREDILDICFLFLIAGLDTVTDSLSCFYAVPSQHSDHRRQLAEHPEVIRSSSRSYFGQSPVPNPPRLVAADAQLCGHAITKGSVLQLGRAGQRRYRHVRRSLRGPLRPQPRQSPRGVRRRRPSLSGLPPRPPRASSGLTGMAPPHSRLRTRPRHRTGIPPGLRSVQNLHFPWPSWA